MPRKEKSFFGKIMGGDVTEEPVMVKHQEPAYSDDEDEELVEELIDDEEEMYEESEAEEEGEAEEVYQPEPVAVPEPQPSPVSKQDEDWMNDYEGALNIDMYQTRDNIIIKSTIAGVRPDDIDITVANDMVTIKGTRRREETISQDDYFYQECYWGGFSRSVIVPVDIDSESIEADLKDGILTIIVPKAAKAKTKRVKVKGL